jgi:Na+/proline symporter
MSLRKKVGHLAMVGGWFWLRAILAGVISGMISDYLMGVLVNRAKTDDFFFEWRYWMNAGIWIVVVAAWIGFMLATRNMKPEQEQDSDNEQDVKR